MTSSLDRAFHRETVLGSCIADEKIVHQHGGTGVYAGIRVEVRSLSRGKGVAFAWNAGSNIPSKYAAAVIQGIRDTISTGVLAGLELTDVLVSVEDGSYHEQDSNEAAFRAVARKATIAAFRQARPTVLEAISICRAVFPMQYGSAITEIALEEGQIESVQSETDTSLVVAIPTSRMDKLLQQVLSITNGLAKFSVEARGFRSKPEPPETVDMWAPVA